MNVDQMTAILKNYREMKRSINTYARLQDMQRILKRCKTGNVTIPPLQNAHDSHIPKYDIIVSLDDVNRKICELKPIREQYEYLTGLVDALIESLDDDNKALINALYREGVTYDRAAEVLNISRATVTDRRKRAIKKMIWNLKGGEIHVR